MKESGGEWETSPKSLLVVTPGDSLMESLSLSGTPVLDNLHVKDLILPGTILWKISFINFYFLAHENEQILRVPHLNTSGVDRLI